MGVQTESFCNNDNTIDSGGNVLNNNVKLLINYEQVDANYAYNLAVFALHDIIIVIDLETGSTTAEF